MTGAAPNNTERQNLLGIIPDEEKAYAESIKRITSEVNPEAFAEAVKSMPQSDNIEDRRKEQRPILKRVFDTIKNENLTADILR